MNIANQLDGNVEKKFYIASPFMNSTGEYFSYSFQMHKDSAYLVIENEERDEINNVVNFKKNEKVKLKFFITFKYGTTELGISQLNIIGSTPLMHYSPQFHIPVMELLIDIVGDGVSINYLVRPKGEEGFNVYRVEFVKTKKESRHIRGDFRQTLVRW